MLSYGYVTWPAELVQALTAQPGRSQTIPSWHGATADASQKGRLAAASGLEPPPTTVAIPKQNLFAVLRSPITWLAEPLQALNARPGPGKGATSSQGPASHIL